MFSYTCTHNAQSNRAMTTDLVFFKNCSTKNPMNNILQKNCTDMTLRKKVSQTFWNNAQCS